MWCEAFAYMKYPCEYPCVKMHFCRYQRLNAEEDYMSFLSQPDWRH